MFRDAVQHKAWMDSNVWSTYLRTVMLPCIMDNPVLLVDNLECHVSDEFKGIVQISTAVNPNGKEV
ncbi:hypothetical protein GN244_ATG12351 [Phytophthora infestans]|uniref:DDE-1 domain-containing protein n=1 Tax=Phytophthora infestans TaxID=4787 RepID=A0A833RYP6_PHYIN|nr:hypothetical protein GN244_ATG12351 [Phytophthora infestans]KAF4135336.1 hypothetical protein GN958_ATG15458 [Phytophthora infestans]